MCDCNKKNTISNLMDAAKSQVKPFKWFKDGITGLVKCITSESNATVETIKHRRDVCRSCEFVTKSDKGDLITLSQCMAVDPATGQKCGCFITCKTQLENEKCPLGKWENVTLTRNNESIN